MDSHEQQPLAIRSTTDAGEFRERIAGLVAADPVRHSVIATNVTRQARVADPGEDNLWVWAEVAGEPVAVAMHTPPRPPHLPTDNMAAAVAMAEFFAGTGRLVDGVGGAKVAARAFAHRWTNLHRYAMSRVSTVMDQGVYELDHVVVPAEVAGHLRLADLPDTPLLKQWAQGFQRDIGELPRTGEDLVSGRIAAGRLWVWEDKGEPRSMVYASPAHGGVSRLSFVYTPPARRGRGYASAAVAAASAIQVGLDHRCMLYTDLANPTSNGIYQAVGYRRCGDSVLLRFHAGPPQAAETRDRS